MSQSLISWRSSPSQTVTVFLFRLPLTKSFGTSPNTLSSLWRRREHQQQKQKKGGKNIPLCLFMMLHGFALTALTNFRSRLLKVLRSYVEESKVGKGGEDFREELKQVIFSENFQKKSRHKRTFFQVGEKGKDQMEQSCTENKQWKEVGLTNNCWLNWLQSNITF